MMVAKICWYLCGLFLVALVVTSAITYHPEAQGLMGFLLGSTATLSILFGVAAVILARRRFTGPRWLVRVFQGLAVLATLGVAVVIGG